MLEKELNKTKELEEKVRKLEEELIENKKCTELVEADDVIQWKLKFGKLRFKWSVNN